jgi:hypothetical protein
VSEARIPDRVLTNAARQMTVCADARQMANYRSSENELEIQG